MVSLWVLKAVCKHNQELRFGGKQARTTGQLSRKLDSIGTFRLILKEMQ